MKILRNKILFFVVLVVLIFSLSTTAFAANDINLKWSEKNPTTLLLEWSSVGSTTITRTTTCHHVPENEKRKVFHPSGRKFEDSPKYSNREYTYTVSVRYMNPTTGRWTTKTSNALVDFVDDGRNTYVTVKKIW